jgi:mono/diheme cytochrome c family protein
MNSISLCMMSAFALALSAAFVGCRQPSAEDGRLLFNKDCARCHEHQSGEASPAPNLAGYFSRNPRPTWRQTRSLIREGKRAMPPFGQRLTSREIDDLIAYIKTLRSPGF